MNSPRRMTIRLLAATLVLGLNWTVQTAHAEEELRKGIAGIAQDLKKLLAGRSEDSLAITKMEGPANLPTSAGPGLIQLLSLELKKVGITVKTRPEFGMKS